MNNKYFSKLLNILILVFLLLFVLGGCTNYSNNDQNTTQNIKNNKNIDKVKKPDTNTEFVEIYVNKMTINKHS